MPKTINQRFAEAWKTIQNPRLDSENPHFHNKYASRQEIMRVIREVCEKNELVYLQLKNPDAVTPVEGAIICSRVEDAEGNVKELSRWKVDDPPAPQAKGSETTYTLRYQACADWGIVGEEEDDGEQAQSITKPTAKPISKPAVKPTTKPAQKPNDEVLRLWETAREEKQRCMDLSGDSEKAEAKINEWMEANIHDSDFNPKPKKEFTADDLHALIKHERDMQETYKQYPLHEEAF